MPNVKGPLFSMEASGTLGGTITFDKRGFVRQRVIPANPQTALQGNTRQVLLGVQKGLTHLGATVIAAVKALAPTSYRWNSYLLQQVIGSSSAEFVASRTAYAALPNQVKTLWHDAAVGIGFVEASVAYASDAAIDPGLALFAISRALFNLGLNVVAGAPGADNAEQWAAYIAS